MTPSRLTTAACLAVTLSVAAPAQDPGTDRRKALDEATRDLRPPSTELGSARVGDTTFRLLDVSLNILGAIGTSTERDASLQTLQGGAHDPRKRGFTLQQAELGLKGAVDPYFNAEAYIIHSIDPIEGESTTELEEAFLSTTSLPFGLQVEAGTFFTEFGRINSRHPHQWHFVDQPIVASRMFGGDGMRGPGARVGWLLPTDFFAELHFGVQNANGETMASFLANDELFEERPIGGRAFADREVRSLQDLVYLARLDTGFDVGDATSMKFGVSGLIGPNATGDDGRTVIYGADFVWKWRPPENDKGWPFVVFESEVIARRYRAAEQVDASDPLNPVTLPRTTLDDYGFYAQLIYGFAPRWAAGLRGEYVSGRGASYDATTQTFAGRSGDAFRDDRLRISPLLAHHPTEFSRLRLQYSFDDADRLDGGDAHSVWLGFEVLFGRHPAHAY